ncbi:tRNA (guanosine(46)-N7)-methyltransferase TrmB [Pseudoflavonifractor sp. 524-17]|nr:tRNA (guanosine(46)-N7)-methyltransferase TrmB [Pseudoflavonifractor sp. 524-17]
MRMRKKPNLELRMDRCASLLAEDPQRLRGRWRSLYPEARALYLEIGCGKGRFTVETAAQNPDCLFVAIERVPDAMIIAMERAKAQDLNNVCFIDADAARLRDYFAPGEVERIYLNFSDPWPSNRHAKRRLTHTDFLMRYRQVLCPGGQIHFKTDNRDLYEWSLFQFPKAGFSLSEVDRDLHRDGIRGVFTDYEEKFYNLGTPINRCVGTLAQLPDGMRGWMDPLDKREASGTPAPKEEAPSRQNLPQ